MTNMWRTAGWLAGMTLVLAGAGRAGADEDLAVVKKAVAMAGSVQAPATPPAEAPETAAKPRTGAKPEPQWLRVRVFERDEKGETHKRVSVNLPLALVRLIDDVPIDLCHHHHGVWNGEAKKGERRCELKVADVLAALEAGQQLVEVEADDATVKVWVE